VSLGFAAGPVNYDPAASVAGLLGRTSRIARVSPISVTIERDTAVLRGQVLTTRDRQLAEDLVRMEPGIWQVRNELVVGASR
jgi:osmotically-inducible protein OsmY